MTTASQRPLRFFVVYRHYWPDNGHFAQVLKAVLEQLVREGHDVRVFSAQPSYKVTQRLTAPRREVHGGVRIFRMPLPPERRDWLWLRALNALLFLAGAVIAGLLGPRPDLVFINSAPAFLPGFAARTLRRLRGVPYLYNIQDVHPEAARIGGMLRQPWLIRWLQRVERRHCEAARSVLTLSGDMAEALKRRGYGGANITVVNNFQVAAADTAPATAAVDAREFVVLYAGNHGRFQGLQHVVDGAALLKERADVRFVFMGEGPAKAEVMAKAKRLHARIEFLGHQPWSQALRTIASADLALVPIQRGMIGVSYPSKLVTSLAAGTPILATVEDDSALARFIRSEDLGEACPPDDPDRLAAAVAAAASRGKVPAARRQHLRRIAQEHFGADRLLPRWTAAFTAAATP